MKKKLLLINPVARYIKRKPRFLPYFGYAPFEPLNLAIIAALTPDHWEIEIFDEILEPFSYREADLVGITSYTGSAYRAYQIAQQYRQNGTPVVMGGIHASMMPEEAQQYVDSVVIGEAEGVWEKVISDFETGQMQNLYRAEMLPMEGAPLPRRDLLSNHYSSSSVQTTRGCPKDCEFCSVTAFNGQHYRKRPVEEVLDELETISNRFIFFVDDNFLEKGKESEERAMALFKGMIDRNIDKYWTCQAPISIADNDELLHYAHKSGGRLILMGIESEKEEALDTLGKKLNRKHVASYNDIFKRIHKHKICIVGTFIFGLDTDTPQDLYNRAKFIKKSRVDIVQPTILTPLPGTKLYDRFKEENRLVHTNYPEDWEKYDWSQVVYEPARMSREELKKTMLKCWKSLGNWGTVLWKAIKTLFYTRSLLMAYGMLNINYVYSMQYYRNEFRD